MAHTGTPAPSTTARYFVGQAVEVFTVDFRIAGFPKVWIAGTVFEVLPCGKDGKMLDLGITLPNTTAGGGTVSQRERVGVRGGNKNLRAA